MEVKKRNLESSILFIQQEHASTLKGLHQEISKLQKRCSELNFQLTTGTSSDSKDYEGTIELLTRKLTASEQLTGSLKEELGNRDKIIIALKDQVTSRESMFLADIKSKNAEVMSLSAQLDSQSDHVAYLATELHKHKVLSLSHKAQRSKVITPSSDSQEKTRYRRAVRVISPISSPSDILQPISSLSCSSDANDDLTLVPVRPSSGASVRLRRQSMSSFSQLGSVSFDNEDMTNQGDSHLRFKPTPPVLPPIGSAKGSRSGLVTVERGRFTRRPYSRQQTSAVLATSNPESGKFPTGADIEVASLAVGAVGQVSPRRKSFVSESNPTDCS